MQKTVRTRAKAPLGVKIQALFIEKFGDERVIDTCNEMIERSVDEAIQPIKVLTHDEYCNAYWRENVTDKKGGAISTEDYVKWIDEITLKLEKRKKYKSSDIYREIVVADWYYGPVTIEAYEEVEKDKEAMRKEEEENRG